MRRSKAYVVLAALLAAGCASSARGCRRNVRRGAGTRRDASRGRRPSNVVPNTVVDANELVARTPPPVICKEILKPGSNVHIQQCMTADELETLRALRSAKRRGARANDAGRRLPLSAEPAVGFPLQLDRCVTRRNTNSCLRLEVPFGGLRAAVADRVRAVLAFGLTAFRAQKQHLESSGS